MGGGDIQGEESLEDNFLRVWSKSGGVVLEGAHGEETWHECTADEGGGIGWREPVRYVVSLPRVLKTARCLVTGCQEVAHSEGRPREHSMYIHFFSWVTVVQEGKNPFPCCDSCGTQMPVGRMIKHQRMQRYVRNNQMRWQRRDAVIATR